MFMYIKLKQIINLDYQIDHSLKLDLYTISQSRVCSHTYIIKVLSEFYRFEVQFEEDFWPPIDRS